MSILNFSLYRKSLLYGNAVLTPSFTITQYQYRYPSYHKSMAMVVWNICTGAELTSGLLRPMSTS